MSQSTTNIWRGLDDLAETPEFKTFAAKEFPGFANVYESLGEAELVGEPQELANTPALNRRQFVALSAAALGLAGLAGCRRPDLQILPYSHTPEFVVPGIPLYYATSMPRPGGCTPILVESHEGRPTKIEGNPQHPASMGATDVHSQASILDLYSPDRSREVLRRNKEDQLIPKSWEEFDDFAPKHFAALKKQEGEGLSFLVEDQPSPALRLLREHLKETFPKATWHVYEPISTENSREATKTSYGTPLVANYLFKNAYRIVSLDCDFLGLDGNEIPNSRGFAELRRDPHLRHLFGGGHKHDHKGHDHKEEKHDPADEVSRLYMLENSYTTTGTLADHRLRIPAAHIVDYAISLAREIVSFEGVKVDLAIKEALNKAPAPGVLLPAKWIKEVAADLVAFKSKGLVLAGNRQPPLVHVLCQFINEALGNTGKTVEYRPLAEDVPATISELHKAIEAGNVKTLVIVGGNPVYNMPADLNLGSVPTIVRLGQFVDDTSEKATWHLPQAHYLESWGDAETADGTYSIIQPLIAPLHGGRSLLELLILISGYDRASSYSEAKSKVYSLLQKSFAKRAGTEDELAFKRFIHEGFVAKSDRKVVKPEFAVAAVVKAISAYKPPRTISDKNIEITFQPDYSLYDGRYAWNGWLLELPDPLTKLVWDNAALVSQKTAEVLKLKHGDFLEIEANGTSIKIPTFIMPGQADWSVTLPLGYGKLRPSRVADGGGFNVYPLRTSKAMGFATAAVTKAGGHFDLVTTQEHGTIPKDKDHEIIQDFTLADYEKRLHAHEHSAVEEGEGGKKEGGHEHHVDDPKSRFQWGYDESSYKSAGRRMRDIKKIALATAQDLSFPQRLDGHMQWGMVIDLNTCTGCSACVVACQAENNIPIVGKGEVKRNREMHWISLHRYFMTKKDEVTGGLESPPAEDPRIVTQPMMCQQCEAAPCESVCPVNAAVHSPEGLNLQVYNRCIGTRYCSNNCPYKARRFNWFDFNKRRLDELRVPTPFSEAGTPETLKMQKNPEVTVRMRGVMEKCTYCIQRIERAKIGSKVLAIKAGADKIDAAPPADPFKAGFDIRTYDGGNRVIVPDGIITTACAQACPTGAIVFGNVRDERSKVHKLKNVEGGPDYLVLGSLNTKPRTSYLPRLRNVNPKMTAKEGHS